MNVTVVDIPKDLGRYRVRHMHWAKAITACLRGIRAGTVGTSGMVLASQVQFVESATPVVVSE